MELFHARPLTHPVRRPLRMRHDLCLGHAARFERGPTDSECPEGYEPITTHRECKQAARSLALSFPDDEVHTSQPPHPANPKCADHHPGLAVRQVGMLRPAGPADSSEDTLAHVHMTLPT